MSDNKKDKNPINPDDFDELTYTELVDLISVASDKLETKKKIVDIKKKFGNQEDGEVPDVRFITGETNLSNNSPSSDRKNILGNKLDGVKMDLPRFRIARPTRSKKREILRCLKKSECFNITNGLALILALAIVYSAYVLYEDKKIMDRENQNTSLLVHNSKPSL